LCFATSLIYDRTVKRATLLIRGAPQAALVVTLMFALLFLTAGSIHFWQGWVCLAIFTLCTLAISADLLIRDPALFERRMRGGPLSESRPIQRIIQAVAAVVWFGIIALAGFDHRYGWSRLPAVVVITADAIFVAAFLGIALVLRANSFAGATIGIASDQRLVSTGPYAWVRHPMYTGAILMIAAMGFALGSAWAALLTVPLAGVVVVRIRDEEELLTAELRGYAGYRAAVKWRLVPGIW
jgi:protein-S-isoprenylcysteine O-methyltransferase Ste14